jgi:tRNA threonylcarbamoyladenosine biosynthesis protein TsaB
MRTLALDTALAACSVALADDDRVLVALSEPMTRGHAERIAPMAFEAMSAAHAALASVDRVVVTTGPGSFTGVRVGLAFARALALALGRPCVGVATLEALALEEGEDGDRAGVIAAPDGVFLAIYRDGATLVAPRRMSQAEARAILGRYDGVAVSGPAAHEFAGRVVAAPDVAALARRGARLDPDAHPPAPLYLRAPDARPVAAP